MPKTPTEVGLPKQLPPSGVGYEFDVAGVDVEQSWVGDHCAPRVGLCRSVGIDIEASLSQTNVAAAGHKIGEDASHTIGFTIQ